MIEADQGYYGCDDFRDEFSIMNDKAKSIKVPKGYHVILDRNCE
jgi:hypothetical protein